MAKDNPNDQPSRRAFLKTLTYVAPTILTLQARPAFAQRGSSITNQGGGNSGGNSGGNGGGNSGGNGGGNSGGNGRGNSGGNAAGSNFSGKSDVTPVAAVGTTSAATANSTTRAKTKDADSSP